MKLREPDELELDLIDLQILRVLQRDCKISLARIGEIVGLSAPAVIDRIKKLEQSGVIKGYHANLDARQLGLDVTAFIGVSIEHPTEIGEMEEGVAAIEDVLECHHVTGQHTLLLKVKTRNTSTLEQLISHIRCLPGVARTETMVVLSTHTERIQLPLAAPPEAPARRKNGRTPHGAHPDRQTLRVKQA
jgi:Lrp/AsnC family leucine-responsive transcriptional regulator